MREIRDNNSMYTLNQDDIQMYLKDLRQIDVMTPEREKELSNIMCLNAMVQHHTCSVSSISADTVDPK